MYIMDINDGETIIKCLNYNYGLYGSGANIAATIENFPKILNDIYEIGGTMDKVVLYEESLPEYKRYSPIFLKVRIDEIITGLPFYSVAMRSSEYTCIRSDVVKNCLEPGCGYKIEYPLIMMGLLSMQISEKTAEKIWESSHTEFFCCKHFDKLTILIEGS